MRSELSSREQELDLMKKQSLAVYNAYNKDKIDEANSKIVTLEHEIEALRRFIASETSQDNIQQSSQIIKSTRDVGISYESSFNTSIKTNGEQKEKDTNNVQTQVMPHS